MKGQRLIVNLRTGKFKKMKDFGRTGHPTGLSLYCDGSAFDKVTRIGKGERLRPQGKSWTFFHSPGTIWNIG